MNAEISTPGPLAGQLMREGVIVTPGEAIAYDMIAAAAASNQPCPDNIDIELANGWNSCSQGPKMVKRLEIKGLIVVRRYQRFREVQIVATGEWTARSRHQHTERPHVPKNFGASRSPAPTDRKPYRKGKR